jgi:hypothetical protein
MFLKRISWEEDVAEEITEEEKMLEEERRA